MYRKLKMAFVVFTVDSPREPRKISNEEIAELAHKNSDVAIPFASISPHRGAEGVAAARRLIQDYKVRGFKFHPSVQEFFPNDRLAYPPVRGHCRSRSCRRSSIPGRPAWSQDAWRRRDPPQILQPALPRRRRRRFSRHADHPRPSFVPLAGGGAFGRDPQAAGVHRPLGLVAEVLSADPRPVREYAPQGPRPLRLRLPRDCAGEMGRGVRKAAHQARGPRRSS